MDEKKRTISFSKEAVNIIRTTQRNNIELTNIADNKANVLLSLNAIMVTFLLPLIGPNLRMIIDGYFYIPLIILATTCFTTIYISTRVLKPQRFQEFKAGMKEERSFSPFFFGNFYKMEPEEFFEYLEENLSEKKMLKSHLAQDLYYLGKRLAAKMNYIRLAFNIFTIGLLLSIVSTILVFIFLN